MDSRPDPGKYKPLISAIIVDILSVCLALIGIFSLTNAFVSSHPSPLSLPYGIAGIIGSALLGIVAHLAQDIHYQRYLTIYQVEEAAWYHTKSLQMLYSIEHLLIQQQIQHQDTAPNNPEIPAQFQQVPPPWPASQNPQPDNYNQYFTPSPNGQEPMSTSPGAYKNILKKNISKKIKPPVIDDDL